MSGKKRKKQKKKRGAAEPASRSASGEAKTSLKDLLAEVDLSEPAEPPKEPARASAPPAAEPASRPDVPALPVEKPVEPSVRPSDTLSGEDRIAYFESIRGVRPLKGAARAAARSTRGAKKRAPRAHAPTLADEAARARLAALVSGGVRFDVEREDEVVFAVRTGHPLRIARDLRRPGVTPEATLDLHGLRADEAAHALSRFLRRQAARGVRRCCVVTGKGLHSEGGLGVLRDRVERELTDGPAASTVRAFATAPARFGGAGALLVELLA